MHDDSSQSADPDDTCKKKPVHKRFYHQIIMSSKKCQVPKLLPYDSKMLFDINMLNQLCWLDNKFCNIKLSMKLVQNILSSRFLTQFGENQRMDRGGQAM